MVKRLFVLALITLFILQAMSVPAVAQVSTLPFPSAVSGHKAIAARGFYDAYAMGIPAEYGTITSRFKGASGKTIIYIQDYHSSSVVQKNIAKMIEFFAERGRGDTIGDNNAMAQFVNAYYPEERRLLVGVEGAEGLIDVDRFRAFPYRNANERAAGQLIKDGIFQAAEYAAVVSPVPVTLWGVEDPTYYLQNYESFLRVYENRENFLKVCRVVETVVKNKELRAGNKLLCLFNDAIALSEGDTGAYYLELIEWAKKLHVDISAFSSIYELAESSVRAQGDGVFSLISDYHDVSCEAKELECAIRARLAVTPDEKAFASIRNAVAVFKKLITLTATRRDVLWWEEHDDLFSYGFYDAFLRDELSAGLCIDAGLWGEFFAQLRKFYACAAKREQSFVQNLLVRMDAEARDVALLVAGGYHGRSIMRLLQEQNISYVSIAPQVNASSADIPYDELLCGTRDSSAVLPPSGNLALCHFFNVLAEKLHEVRKLNGELLVADVQKVAKLFEEENGIELVKKLIRGESISHDLRVYCESVAFNGDLSFFYNENVRMSYEIFLEYYVVNGKRAQYFYDIEEFLALIGPSEQTEEVRVIAAMIHTLGDRERAARLLMCTEESLISRLKKYALGNGTKFLKVSEVLQKNGIVQEIPRVARDSAQKDILKDSHCFTMDNEVFCGAITEKYGVREKRVAVGIQKLKILSVLCETNGNIKETAAFFGVRKSAMYALLKKVDISSRKFSTRYCFKDVLADCRDLMDIYPYVGAPFLQLITDYLAIVVSCKHISPEEAAAVLMQIKKEVIQANGSEGSAQFESKKIYLPSTMTKKELFQVIVKNNGIKGDIAGALHVSRATLDKLLVKHGFDELSLKKHVMPFRYFDIIEALLKQEGNLQGALENVGMTKQYFDDLRWVLQIKTEEIDQEKYSFQLALRNCLQMLWVYEYVGDIILVRIKEHIAMLVRYGCLSVNEGIKANGMIKMRLLEMKQKNDIPFSVQVKHAYHTTDMRAIDLSVNSSSEKAQLVAAMIAANGNRSKVAEQFGVDQTTIVYRLKKYGLDPIVLTDIAQAMEKIAILIALVKNEGEKKDFMATGFSKRQLDRRIQQYCIASKKIQKKEYSYEEVLRDCVELVWIHKYIGVQPVRERVTDLLNALEGHKYITHEHAGEIKKRINEIMRQGLAEYEKPWQKKEIFIAAMLKNDGHYLPVAAKFGVDERLMAYWAKKHGFESNAIFLRIAEALEKMSMLKALARTRGNVHNAMTLVALKKSQFYKKIKRMRIDSQDFKKNEYGIDNLSRDCHELVVLYESIEDEYLAEYTKEYFSTSVSDYLAVLVAQRYISSEDAKVFNDEFVSILDGDVVRDKKSSVLSDGPEKFAIKEGDLRAVADKDVHSDAERVIEQFIRVGTLDAVSDEHNVRQDTNVTQELVDAVSVEKAWQKKDRFIRAMLKWQGRYAQVAAKFGVDERLMAYWAKKHGFESNEIFLRIADALEKMDMLKALVAARGNALQAVSSLQYGKTVFYTKAKHMHIDIKKIKKSEYGSDDVSRDCHELVVLFESIEDAYLADYTKEYFSTSVSDYLAVLVAQRYISASEAKVLYDKFLFMLDGDVVANQEHNVSLSVLDKFALKGAACRTLADEDFRSATKNLRARYTRGESLDDLLVDAFALVREAARRTIGEEPNNTQLLGAIAIHQGRGLEMFPSEGKTLTAVVAAYLNAISGKGVHIATLNDYLACRDAEKMGRIFEFLGLSVGVISSDTAYVFNSECQEKGNFPCLRKMTPDLSVYWQSKESYFQQYYAARKVAHSADIVYGANDVFVFDYLHDVYRDRNAERIMRMPEQVGLMIADEGDAYLLDGYLEPHVMVRPFKYSMAYFYREFYRIAEGLRAAHDADALYELDYGHKAIVFTSYGSTMFDQQVESFIANYIDGKKSNSYRRKHTSDGRDASLYAFSRLLFNGINGNPVRGEITPIVLSDFERRLCHIFVKEHIQNALKFFYFYRENDDYLIENNKVFIVDEYTGRIKPDHVWGYGLKQFIEIKKGLPVSAPYETIGEITNRTFFNMYKKLSLLSGSIGTTGIPRVRNLYKREVVSLPRAIPCIRKNLGIEIYRTKKEKMSRIVQLMKNLKANGSPLLLSFRSMQEAKEMKKLFQENGLSSNLLCADNVTDEVRIIAQAGKIDAVNISTILDRGTNIPLHEGVREVGGITLLSCELPIHERALLQSENRVARRGDPGSFRAIYSLEDAGFHFLRQDDSVMMALSAMLETRKCMADGDAQKCIEYVYEQREKTVHEKDEQLIMQDKLFSEKCTLFAHVRELIMQHPTSNNGVIGLDGVTKKWERFLLIRNLLLCSTVSFDEYKKQLEYAFREFMISCFYVLRSDSWLSSDDICRVYSDIQWDSLKTWEEGRESVFNTIQKMYHSKRRSPLEQDLYRVKLIRSAA